jgi:tetratricopeptide (TPR) repeat protein
VSQATLEMGGITVEPGDRIGAFVYVRPIGKGGMAHVVLAKDPNDQEVALKILKASRLSKGMARFRREFRALSRIRHPNVIRVDAYGDLHGHPFIAMEYVEGKDLHQTIRGFRFIENAAERWTRCEAILVDMCRALSHVHQKGLVHRDLKPSNILMGPDGRGHLTDFGIVKDLDPGNDGFQSGTLVGTWAYASPEQISGHPIDHRSDLYSLGIILFAMLTGCRPFDEKDMKGYLDAHRNKIPPRPRQYDHRIPRHLDEICWRLLQKHPKDRFQSAREILYRLEQLDEPENPTLTGTWRLPLVGRGAELELVHDAVDRLTRSAGGMLVLEAREGMGRTRLLDHAAERASAIGIPVHRMRGEGGAAGLFGLIELCQDVLRVLGDSAAPELRTIVSDFRRGNARGGDALYRLMDALRPALLAVLAEGPRILLYDDFHEVPPRGMELMTTLVRTLIGIGEPLLMVVSVRSEDVHGKLERFLRGEGLGVTPTHLRLEPLSRNALLGLTARLMGAGQKSEALAVRLHQETEGNPLFITQFLESLIQGGMLVQGPKGLYHLNSDTDEISTGHLEIPRGVRSVIRKRLEKLAPGEVLVLQALAVSGRALELDLLLEILDAEEDEVMDDVDRLIDRGIVVERRTGGLVHHDVSNRLVADVVYRDLSTDRRALLHLSVADCLEHNFATVPAAIELVGDHYRLAGEAGKAFAYLIQAAERMLARSLPSPAWDLSVRAKAVEDLASVELDRDRLDDLRVRLMLVRAQIQWIRGEWADCRATCEALVRLADLVEAAVPRAMARSILSKVLARLDEPERAREQAQLALFEARGTQERRAVAEALYACCAIAWEEGRLDEVQRLASEGLLLTGNDVALEELRGELMLAETAVQAANGQLALATSGLTEATAIFERTGKKATHCVALCNLGEMLMWQGRLLEAREATNRALRIADDIRYRVGRAAAYRVRGEVMLELGLLERAQSDVTEALAESSALSVHQEMVACRYSLARLARRQGQVTEVASHVAIARNLAHRKDPERYLAALLALAAWVCGNQNERTDALRMLDRAEATLDSLPVPRRAQVMVGAAEAYAALHEPARAQRLAAEAAGLARSRGLRLLDLEARLLLARLVDEPQTASWRAEARALAEAFEAELTPELAKAFHTRPGMAGLYT